MDRGYDDNTWSCRGWIHLVGICLWWFLCGFRLTEEIKVEDINFDAVADETDDIEDCVNKGCGFNVDGKCTANGTECFGYIDPEWD